MVRQPYTSHLLDGGSVDLVIIFGDERRQLEANVLARSFKHLTIHHFGLNEYTNLVTTALRARVVDILLAKAPHGIITHSPADAHPDHASTSNLVHAALLMLGMEAYPKQMLYCNSYFGGQANNAIFHPDTFVDISSVSEIKYQSIRNHASQDPAFWVQMAENIDILNGMRCGVARAEAFQRATHAFYQHASATII